MHSLGCESPSRAPPGLQREPGSSSPETPVPSRLPSRPASPPPRHPSQPLALRQPSFRQMNDGRRSNPLEVAGKGGPAPWQKTPASHKQPVLHVRIKQSASNTCFAALQVAAEGRMSAKPIPSTTRRACGEPPSNRFTSALSTRSVGAKPEREVALFFAESFSDPPRSARGECNAMPSQTT